MPLKTNILPPFPFPSQDLNHPAPFTFQHCAVLHPASHQQHAPTTPATNENPRLLPQRLSDSYFLGLDYYSKLKIQRQALLLGYLLAVL